MIYIKRFIEKVSLIESRNGKDVVLPIADARGLRDELSKLLVDLYDDNKSKQTEEPTACAWRITGGDRPAGKISLRRHAGTRRRSGSW